jgi:hypothetical protein
VEINPPLNPLNPIQADEILSGELSRFNEWFVRKQQERGVVEASSLTSFERGAVKAYLLFAATDRPKDPQE